MSGKDLLESMNYIDERFIDEAENQTIRRKPTPVLKWAAAAACLCIVLLGVMCAGFLMNGETSGEGTGIVLQDLPGGGKPEAQPPELIFGDSMPFSTIPTEKPGVAPACPKPGDSLEAGGTNEIHPYFVGKVLEKYEKGCLLEITDQGNRFMDTGTVVTVNTDLDGCPEYSVGDYLRVEFDGTVAETYPPQIIKVIAIDLLNSAENQKKG
jgi:hypothetical protein